MTRIFAGCALSAGILWLGCQGGVGHPPTARILATPGFVPLGDAYQTEIVLDGTASRDDVDDPAGIQPLLYEWVVEDPKSQLLPSPTAARVTVRVAGTHPVTVHLTVANGADIKATSDAQIGVTLP